jgi:hypothetical protein
VYVLFVHKGGPVPEQVAAWEENLEIDDVQPVQETRPARRLRSPRTVWWCAFIALVLFACYIRLSWTVPVNSDGAANILQAQSILRGDLRLHGWWLSDASFYTTELPQYVILVALLGAVPAVVHVAAAMTYTLAVVLAAVLAKGRATGREGVLRMVIAAGIMLAPQPGGGLNVGGGAFVLDLSLGHIGTAIPLLITWLVIDRAGRRRWVPPVVGILLAWVLTADSLVVYVGIIPLVVVCGIRAYQDVVIARRPIAAAWFEIALAACALAALPVSAGVLAYIRSIGGFIVYPDHPVLATGAILPSNVAVTFQGVLTLFGANFLGQSMGFDLDLAFVHLAGVVLACWAVWLGLRKLARRRGPDGLGTGGLGTGGLAEEVMAVAVVANLFAFVFSTLAIDPSYAREIAVVLPFSAALAGRLLAKRLASSRLLPVLGAVLVCYIAGLGFGVAQPAVPTMNQPLAAWLENHHLRYGLGEYWQANSITLASGQRVLVRPVDVAPGGKIGAYPWESQAGWYNAAYFHANFVVLYPDGAPYRSYPTYRQTLRTFGQPDQTWHLGDYLVLVYHKNLLNGLACGDIYGLPSGQGRSQEVSSCK